MSACNTADQISNCDQRNRLMLFFLRSSNREPPMSELGQKRRFDRRPVTSGLPRSTDILRVRRHVSNGPTTDPKPIDNRRRQSQKTMQ